MKIYQHPHAPVHLDFPGQLYFLTAGTHKKESLFDTPKKLLLLKNELLKTAKEHALEIHAYSLLSNHYHLLFDHDGNSSLSKFMIHFHGRTSFLLNKIEKRPGRKVWYQYWDRCIRNEKEYLSNLSYIYWNPVKHGYATDPKGWPFTWVKDTFFYKDFSPEPYSWDNF